MAQSHLLATSVRKKEVGTSATPCNKFLIIWEGHSCEIFENEQGPSPFGIEIDLADWCSEPWGTWEGIFLQCECAQIWGDTREQTDKGSLRRRNKYHPSVWLNLRMRDSRKGAGWPKIGGKVNSPRVAITKSGKTLWGLPVFTSQIRSRGDPCGLRSPRKSA